jgi:uncharacterized protein YlxW (UPF0749 family)
MALACASFLAASAAVPEPVPDYALQAEEIYRLEIGMSFFVAFYLATMAMMLALSGRGFAEFGTQGVRARAVIDRAAGSKQQETLSRQLKATQQTERKLEELHARVADLRENVDLHQKRLENLNSDR